MIDSSIPPDVNPPFIVPYDLFVFTVPGSTLKYAQIRINYDPPTILASFIGVELWITGYFSNKPFYTPYLMEGPFFQYDGNSDPFFLNVENPPNLYLQCDYDSTASNYLNIAHPVNIHIVATSEGKTYPTPITSRPFITLPNGVGT